jgi:hypothetical protein
MGVTGGINLSEINASGNELLNVVLTEPERSTAQLHPFAGPSIARLHGRDSLLMMRKPTTARSISGSSVRK